MGSKPETLYCNLETIDWLINIEAQRKQWLNLQQSVLKVLVYNAKYSEESGFSVFSLSRKV